MAVKYKTVYDEMLKQNKELFDSFRKIHDSYVENSKKNRSEFNAIGEDVQNVIRRYENMLCKHSESGGFGKFTSNLSEKFWEEIRSNFPKIDEIGLL